MQIIIGIIGLGIIVFVHELGHFLAAKYYKVHVLEFAVGMGPVLFSCTRGTTTYSVRMLPLGGFCKMRSPTIHAPNQQQIQQSLDSSVFVPKETGTMFMLSTRQKAVVLMAGPFANIVWYALLSLILFAGNFSVSALPPRIDPLPNSPALRAGLQAGDTVLAIGGDSVHSFSELAETAQHSAGTTTVITYTHAGSRKTTTATLAKTSPFLGAHPFISPTVQSVISRDSQFMPGDVITAVEKTPITNAIYIGQELQKYAGHSASVTVLRGEQNPTELLIHVPADSDNTMNALGVEFETVRINQWKTFGDFTRSRVSQVISMGGGTAAIIGRLIIPKTLLSKLFGRAIQSSSKNDIAGPMRIISFVGANTLGTAHSQGWASALMQFINISAVLSFAIALMNLLPIPALDGGQLAFYAFHSLRRRPVTYRALTRYQSVGVAIMLLLFIVVMFKDVSYLFFGK